MGSNLENVVSKMTRLVGRQDSLEKAAEYMIQRIAVLEVVLNYMIEKDPKLLEGFEEDQKKKAEEAAAAAAAEEVSE